MMTFINKRRECYHKKGYEGWSLSRHDRAFLCWFYYERWKNIQKLPETQKDMIVYKSGYGKPPKKGIRNFYENIAEHFDGRFYQRHNGYFLSLVLPERRYKVDFFVGKTLPEAQERLNGIMEILIKCQYVNDPHSEAVHFFPCKHQSSLVQDNVFEKYVLGLDKPA